LDLSGSEAKSPYYIGSIKIEEQIRMNKHLNNIALCYHQFTGEESTTNQFVHTIDEFRTQLQFLIDNNYIIVSPERFVQWYNGDYIPQQPIATIIIDDGIDNVELVYNLLKSMGIVFGVAIISSRQCKKEPQWGFLSWATLKAWVDAGDIEILCHTHSLHMFGLKYDTDDGNISAQAILEGPCWVSDGQVLHTSAENDPRWWFDETLTDNRALQFPLIGRDSSSLISSDINFKSNKAGNISGMWVKARQVIGEWTSPVTYKVYINDQLVGINTINPQDYPYNDFYYLNMTSSYSLQDNSSYNIKFETTKCPDNIVFTIFTIPTANKDFYAKSSAIDLITTEREPDFPSNKKWPVVPVMLFVGDNNRIATDEEYQSYISGDLERFQNSVSTYLNAQWERHPKFMGDDTLGVIPFYGYKDNANITSIIKYTPTESFTAERMIVKHWRRHGQEYNCIVDIFVGTSADGPWTKLTRWFGSWWDWNEDNFDLDNTYYFTAKTPYFLKFETVNASPYSQEGWMELAIELYAPYTPHVYFEYCTTTTVPTRPTTMVYPYGAYWGIVDSSTGEEKLKPALVNAMRANGLTSGFTIYPGFVDRKDILREQGARSTVFTLPRIMPNALVSVDNVTNNLAAYGGFLWNDCEHGGVIWQVSAEPDPLGFAQAHRSYQCLDYVAFDAYFLRPNGYILRSVINDGGYYFNEITDRAGSFAEGEIITGQTSGASATVVWTNNSLPINTISFYESTGSFVNGDTIRGDISGATATVTGFSEANETIKYIDLSGQFIVGEKVVGSSGSCRIRRWGPYSYDNIMKVKDIRGSFRADEIIIGAVSGAKGTIPSEPVLFVDEKGYLQQNGVKCLLIISNGNYSDPTINDVDPSIAEYVVSNRSQYIDQLVDICITEGWDGITSNLEAVPSDQRKKTTVWLQELAAALHSKGKILHTTAPAITNTDYDALWWVGWCDLKAVAAAVDGIKIMSYTESGPFSSPGSAAPDWFMDAVYKYTAKTIDPKDYHKVFVGARCFGHLWHLGSESCYYLPYAECITTAITNDSAFITFEEGEGHWVSDTLECWFGAPGTLTRAINIAKTYGFGGIGVWQLPDGDYYQHFSIDKK